MPPQCPFCGKSHFRENFTVQTATEGGLPVYKDGFLTKQEPNVISYFCTCMECNRDFSYSKKTADSVILI